MSQNCALCKSYLYDTIQRTPDYLTHVIKVQKIKTHAHEISEFLLRLEKTVSRGHLKTIENHMIKYKELTVSERRYRVFTWFMKYITAFKQEIDSYIYTLYDFGFFKIDKQDKDLTGLHLWLSYYCLPLLQDLDQIHNEHRIKSRKVVELLYGVQIRVVVPDDYNGLYD